MPKSSTPVQIYRVVKSGDNRYDKKDYKKALDNYKRAIGMKPSSDIEQYSYFKIGLCYNALKKYTDAIASLDKSNSIKKNFESYYYKGLILLRMNRFKDAEATFKDSLKIESSKNQMYLSYIYLGRIYLILGNKPKLAFKYLNKAIEINNSDVTAKLLLAETYQQLKKEEKSINLYEEVLAFDNTNKDAITGIITIFVNDSNETKAITYLTQHLKQLKKPDPELYAIKGELHYSLSDFENSLISFRKARSVDKISEKLLIRECRCLLSLKKYDEAIDTLNEFLKQNNANFIANLFLAEVYASNKNYDLASEKLNELLETNSEIIQKPELSQAVANIFLLNNDYYKAETLLENAINLGLDTWVITKQLSVIAIETKNYNKAESYLEKSFKLANNAIELGQSFHLKAILLYTQEQYKDVIKTSDQGSKELSVKQESYYLLKILKAKSLLKLGEEMKAKSLIISLVKENERIDEVIKQDLDLKDLIDS